jgi:hypothetical protein
MSPRAKRGVSPWDAVPNEARGASLSLGMTRLEGHDRVKGQGGVGDFFEQPLSPLDKMEILDKVKNYEKNTP